MPRGDEEMARIDRGPFVDALNKYVLALCELRQVAAPKAGKTGWLELVSDKTGVSRGTLKKMIDGKAVSASSIEDVLQSLKIPALDVVLPEHDLPIPGDVATFLRFRHGYFLADRRSDGGRPYVRWCSETLELRAEVEERPTGATLRARGPMRNEFGLTFQVEFVRLNGYLLTMEAVQEGLTATDPRILFRGMFTGTFNLCFPLPDEDNLVLCGFWHGVTAYGTPASYRFFLATRELETKELKRLTLRFNHKTLVDAEERMVM